EDATAAVGGILTTVAEARGPRAPAAEVIEGGDRAERPAVRKADESSATTKGGPLLERVLQRIPANAPIGTTADVAGQEVARASEDTPPGRSVSHPPRSGFRGLADRVIQEGNRPVAPPLTPENHLSGEAVLDRMDAAIGAS